MPDHITLPILIAITLVMTFSTGFLVGVMYACKSHKPIDSGFRPIDNSIADVTSQIRKQLNKRQYGR